MDFASQGTKQTGAVFDLVACPFVLYSHVWRHAYNTQASLYAEARTVIRRVAGALIGAGWVGLCGCGLYFRCEEIVVPCCKPADTNGLLNQSGQFSSSHAFCHVFNSHKYIHTFFNKFSVFIVISFYNYSCPNLFFRSLQLSSVVVSLMSISIPLISLPVITK